MNNSTKPPKASEMNLIDEAIEESFPASDPPAWTAKKAKHEEETIDILEQKVNLVWERTTQDFDYDAYNRNAVITFGGGESLPVSNPPEFYGDASFANAEELLVAALSFCYMHTFLAIASKQGFKIKRYADNATALLGKNAQGIMSVTEIKLNPKIQFEGFAPESDKLKTLQDNAHRKCFIANSLTSHIEINILSLFA